MLIAAFGPPTPYFNLCKQIVSLIMGLDGESFLAIESDDFEIFREKLLERSAKKVLFTSNIPDSDIVEIIIRNNVTSILFGENSHHAIYSIMKIRNIEFIEAARVLSCHYASIEPIVSLHKNTNIILQSKMSDDLFMLIRDISMALGVDIDQLGCIQLFKCLAFSEDERSIFTCAWQSDETTPPLPIEHFFSQRDSDAIEFTFPSVDNLETVGIRWAPRMLYAINTSHYADELIEITGKSKILFFGPYFYLPRGRWRAKYHLNVARNHSGNTVLADIQGSLIVLAVGKFKLPSEGSFEFFLDFNINSNRVVVESRLQTLEGAIDGFVELISVQCMRI